LILALSTKAMTDRRMSVLIGPLYNFLADYGSEKTLKKLAGRQDIEVALSRLDMLTKEESLMMVVRNLEVTCHVDDVIHDVNDNVQATKALTNDIDDNLKATKMIVEDIDDNLKGILGITRSVDNGTQRFLPVFMLMSIVSPIIPT
jgi:hypothetical protein